MQRSTSAVAYCGVAVSVVLAALALVDQMTTHWTRSDVASHYGRHGLNPDPNLLTILLTVAFLSSALFFALSARAQARGKKAVARGLAITIVICGISFAALAAFSVEYGGPVLVMLWRSLPWIIPAIAVADLMSIKSKVSPVS